MSWNISVYAEQHINGAWNYIMPLHDNFKWLIDYDYFENLQDLPANEFNNVSNELKAAYSESDSDDLFAFCSVKKTTPAKMYSYASSLIEKSTAIKKTIWAALGLPEYTNDDIDPNWNPLTHPVAKELFSKLQEADFGALKGYRILGMLDALEANSDFGANIRLILVRG